MHDTENPNGCLARVLRLAAFALALILLLAAGLLINQSLAMARLREVHPPPGELIDAGGRQMHIYCIGTGSPTVVIDAGNANGSINWMPIQAELAEKIRVCTYDRAGYFWSEPGSLPRDARSAVSELRSLLERAGETDPYLLVGHSLGGFHMQLFAARHPAETAGLVLVDSPAVADFRQEDSQQADAAQIGFYRVMEFLARSGILRAAAPLGGESLIPESAAGLPQALQQTYLDMILDPTFYDTAGLEIEAIPASADQLAGALAGETPLGDLPLIVLTAGHMNVGTPISPILSPVPIARIERQKELSELSSDGHHRIINHSGHLMQIDAPEAIVKAVLDLLAH